MLDKFQKRERQVSLNRLGYFNYRDYLKSDLWKNIRHRVKLKYDYKCCMKHCDKRAYAVHHVSYDYATMSGKNLMHLKPLCKDCHELGHSEDRAEHPDIGKRQICNYDPFWSKK